MVCRAAVAEDVASAGGLPHNGFSIEKTSIAACTQYGHYTGPACTYGITGSKHIGLDGHIFSAKTLLQEDLYPICLLFVAATGTIEVN